MSIPVTNGNGARPAGGPPPSRRAGAAALADDAAPEPPTATGQYPDPVWADPPPSAAMGGHDDDAPAPPSATGQYPDAVWADAPAAGALADDDAPAPPSATGQYPDVVWGDPPAEAPDAAAAAASASPADAPAAEALRPEDRYKEPDFDDGPLGAAGGDFALPPALTLAEAYRIVRTVAEADSGDEPYAAVLADEGHAAEHGLAWGLALFTQASGRLGSVLRLTQRRDAALFDRLFGSDALALLQVANADTPQARLGTVSGRPLTDPEWVERFRAAGAEEACRNAQNEEAIAGQFYPVARYALALGLDTDRGLAMAYDRVVARGAQGGLRWLVEAAGLLRTAAQRRTALLALGHADLAAFRAGAGLAPGPDDDDDDDGAADAETVCLLLEALRAVDAIPLPGAGEVQQRLLAAAGGAARRRLARIRDTDALTDLPYRDA